MTRAHPDVDAYIGRLPSWQQEICRELREVIWAADAEIEETIKRSVQPYFVLNGNATARAIQVYEGDTVDVPALTAMLRAIVANNRAGGWRRLRA